MLKNVFKKVCPITPSQRSCKLLQKTSIFKGKPLKTKCKGVKNRAGRNNRGRITVFHRGGGHKRLYREIDFRRKLSNGVVVGLEYDPFRTAYIARVYNSDLKQFFYILAPQGLNVGATVYSGNLSDIKLGHSLSLRKVPIGSIVYNLSIGSQNTGKIGRAAGTYVQLVQKFKGYARVRICSGEQRLVPLDSQATLGVVSNENVKLINIGKAGRARWLNQRPHVRGVAMNPVDHPHGGGEGKTSGGRPSVTPWGKPTKGPKTSRSRNSLIVVPRKK